MSGIEEFFGNEVVFLGVEIIENCSHGPNNANFMPKKVKSYGIDDLIVAPRYCLQKKALMSR